MSNTFFDESREQSAVKSAIVSKYFDAWAKVIISVQGRTSRIDEKIRYLDLFAGPGRYNDGTQSTPLLVLQKAIDNPILASRLEAVFNDNDANNTRSLEAAINGLEGIEKLQYRPQVFNEEIGTEIVKSFEKSRMCPTLFFIDPWGYKGLSLRLVNSVMKDWGCDCIFFFNYNRINMGLSNPIVQEHMNALFGPEKAERLSRELESLSPDQRELVIVENLAQALKMSGDGYRYVLPFRFKDERGRRTSHHLIFVSKNFLGYEIMKEIMAKESTRSVDGVATFEYNPADNRQPLLFQLSRPLEDLAGQLTNFFTSQTLTMQDVYMRHNVDRPYIKANYKDVLNQMETQGLITAEPPSEKRQMRQGKRTFGDNIKVTFPKVAEKKE